MSMTADSALLDAIGAAGTEGREVLDPATGEVVGRVQNANIEDLEAAVAAAKKAQPD